MYLSFPVPFALNTSKPSVDAKVPLISSSRIVLLPWQARSLMKVTEIYRETRVSQLMSSRKINVLISWL